MMNALLSIMNCTFFGISGCHCAVVALRRLALPQRVASPISAAVELRILADPIGSDATGAAGEWLGIDPRLLHDLQLGCPSCMLAMLSRCGVGPRRMIIERSKSHDADGAEHMVPKAAQTTNNQGVPRAEHMVAMEHK